MTEFLRLAEVRGLDKHARDELCRIQRSFWAKQDRLVHTLDIGIITPNQYLVDFGVLLKDMMDRIRSVLGDERFIVIFGEAGRHPESLIDRDIFMGAMAADNVPHKEGDYE